MSKQTLPEFAPNQQLIKANAFFEAGIARVKYHVKVPVEFKRESVLAKENWVQIVACGFKINVGNLIEIVREDYGFFMEVIVLAVNKEGITVKEIRFAQLEDDVEEKEEGGLRIVWKGPAIKYAVVRTNGKELGKGFATKAEAQNFLENNQ